MSSKVGRARRSHASALPAFWTAMQNTDLGPEPRWDYPASMLAGADQVRPLYISTFPTLSTAAQNVGPGQDTEGMS